MNAPTYKQIKTALGYFESHEIKPEEGDLGYINHKKFIFKNGDWEICNDEISEQSNAHGCCGQRPRN